MKNNDDKKTARSGDITKTNPEINKIEE